MQAQTRAEGARAQISAADGSVARFMRQTGRFLAHFGEMCMVMCLGGAFLMDLLVFGGAYDVPETAYTKLPKGRPGATQAVLRPLKKCSTNEISATINRR